MKILNKKNIPNIISVSRIILVPIIFILIILSYCTNNYILYLKINDIYDYKVPILFLIAAFLFLIAILSDFIDGYIARKYNLISDAGKLLDAIADKILINSILIAFLFENIVPVFVVFLLIIRDFSMDALRLLLSTKKEIILPASRIGKIKTVFIMVGTFILFLINRNLIYISDININMYNWFNQILLIPLYLGLILSIISAKIYFFSSIKNINNINNSIKENKKDEN